MTFIGKKGICTSCKEETLVVSKGLCKKCYMDKWNKRKDIKKMKEEWEKNNRWKRKLRRAERLIQIRTKEFVPINLLKEIFVRDNYTCQYCGSKRELSIDHKQAIANGGNNSKENLVVACVTCNAFKSNLSVEQFRKRYLKKLNLK